ncbi:hypothetical protein [Streptomyces sp. WMMB 322]|uniref:hypothetical protein n=1 Tax=Streptomyces sp. WMMB 322 TaxID=1286821 RepID=UPI0006E376A4|nr:hypothetical protein [Streptomyces sp. WMMB 322]SCK55821.1 hypothetical protein H180DRAFT_05155 [Streptomyces sp. WMMB 322]
MSSATRSPRRAGLALRRWSPRRWTVAACAAAGTALLVGLPTAVVPSPLFSRAVPAQWWSYPTLALTAVLGGVVLATYVRDPKNLAPGPEAPGPQAPGSESPEPGAPEPGAPEPGAGRRLGSVGGVLSFVAVGCPVCNKLVLLLLGTSGALSYWAPLQPFLAVASVLLLAEAALRRLSAMEACPVPPGARAEATEESVSTS